MFFGESKTLKRLTDPLRAELAAIKEAIQEQSTSARKAQEAEAVKRSEISGIITAAINTNQESEAARAERDQGHREQESLIASQKQNC